MWCNNLAHICSPMQFSNAGMSCAERQLLAVASCLGKHSAHLKTSSACSVARLPRLPSLTDGLTGCCGLFMAASRRSFATCRNQLCQWLSQTTAQHCPLQPMHSTLMLHGKADPSQQSVVWHMLVC